MTPAASGIQLPAAQLAALQTPCYLVDVAALERNLQLLAEVRRRTECRILLALKGFAMFRVFPLIREFLDGVAASSVDEARLGREAFGKEVHFCAPAFSPDDWPELLALCDHLVFNSFSLWRRYRDRALSAPGNPRCGIRVNPEHSEVKVPIYDPCAPFSRLGVPRRHFEAEALDGISGLHFHTLCELGADALARTLPAFEEKFGAYLPGMRWVNFGGGHHITRSDYDRELLCETLLEFRRRHPHLDLYLEPGEAIALNAGILVTSVLDVVENHMPIAILDTSAAAHMPDVLEMPYRPEIDGAGLPGEHRYTVRLAGPSCLAGDVMGDYSFQQPLLIGQRLVFRDMAHYSMVKNNTFNGVRLPDIVLRERDGSLRLVRRFGYADYRQRLS
jgi:carboxynorspermidine decarboxylase